MRIFNSRLSEVSNRSNFLYNTSFRVDYSAFFKNKKTVFRHEKKIQINKLIYYYKHHLAIIDT